MRIRRTGYIVWDKWAQKVVVNKNDTFVYSNRKTAWLKSKKERKKYGYRVIKIKLSILNPQ